MVHQDARSNGPVGVGDAQTYCLALAELEGLRAAHREETRRLQEDKTRAVSHTGMSPASDWVMLVHAFYAEPIISAVA
jgi:hypothetical protein